MVPPSIPSAPINPTAPVLVDTSMFTESSASSLESYYPPHQEMVDAGEAQSIIDQQSSLNYNSTINKVKLNLNKMSRNKTKSVYFDAFSNRTLREIRAQEVIEKAIDLAPPNVFE